MPACAALSAALPLCETESFVVQREGGRRPVVTARENTGVLG